LLTLKRQRIENEDVFDCLYVQEGNAMKRMKVVGAIACLLVCCLSLSTASARLDKSSQEPPVGRILGTVTDAFDVRVAHAKVRIEGGKVKWEGESDEAGEFSAEVPAGLYRIFVNANGFRRLESALLKVKPDVSEIVNIHLEVMNPICTVEIKPEKEKP
jgi:hypothetical protein